MPLQLPRTNAKRVDGKATQDLTAHPWAGLKVLMTLIARDQAGQSGESLPYEFVLPERNFTKPLAKAVVEQRKKLVRDPNAPEAVANALDALTLGGDKVIDDSTVYLGLAQRLLAAAQRHFARRASPAWSSSCGRRRSASRKATCPRPSAP